MTIYSPITIRNRLRIYLTGQRPDGTKITLPSPENLKGIKGAGINHLNTNLKLVADPREAKPGDAPADFTDLRRRLVYGFIFGKETEPLLPLSSDDLDPLAILAIDSWIGAKKTTDAGGRDHYTPRDGFTVEVNEIANAAFPWYNSPAKDEPLATLIEKLKAIHPESSRVGAGESDLDSTGVMVGGVVRTTNFIQGITIPIESLLIPAIDLTPPDGSIWCEWCGERYTTPGVPCEKCAELGAKPGEIVPPSPALPQNKPVPAAKPAADRRPEWMRGIRQGVSK